MGAREEPSQVTRRYILTLCSSHILRSRQWLGFLYNDFQAQSDYELVLTYAKQLDVVLWENAKKKAFFASVEGHQNIKGFIERRGQGGK